MQLSTILLAAAALVGSTLGAPIAAKPELSKRMDYSPHITFPFENALLDAGSAYLVSWNFDDMPKAIPPTVNVTLGYSPRRDSGNEHLYWPLAQNVPITNGQADVVLPSYLEVRDDYIIVVAGSSANASPRFTIRRSDIPHKREVYNPAITFPIERTVWTAGHSYQVTWGLADMPESAQGSVVTIKLGYQNAHEQGEHLYWTLAEDVPLRNGEATVTLPWNLAERDDYIIVVMGDSSNKTPSFTIKACNGQ